MPRAMTTTLAPMTITMMMVMAVMATMALARAHAAVSVVADDFQSQAGLSSCEHFCGLSHDQACSCEPS